VPYLARGKQHEMLRAYCETHYPEAKNDLANVFLERCLELSRDQGAGVVQIVMPQNWLFLTSYKKQRESLLKTVQWNLLARLGEGGFDSPQAAGAFIILLTQTNANTAEDFSLRGVDASPPKVAQEKAALLRDGEVAAVSQRGQLANPDARVGLSEQQSGDLLQKFALAAQGMPTSDSPLFVQFHWENSSRGDSWEFHQSTVEESMYWGGCERIVLYEKGNGRMRALAAAQDRDRGRDRQGAPVWGKRGVAIGLMRELPRALYSGTKFDNNMSAVVPYEQEHLPAVWSFCSSADFSEAVRRIDQKLNVTNATLVKVPFDLAHWQRVAAERYPNGLPKPYSDDPTQWLFHGHPQPATDPLQVAIARLAGYRWPAETDMAMELADEARAWIACCEQLAEHTDDDGIVCLPSVRGEAPAHDRLLKLLIAAWSHVHGDAHGAAGVQPGSWKPAVLDKLLADAECAGKGLDVWLREKFFEQHAKRFQHRPFIWHVWDGLKDGFAALVNYHQLDHKKLERLIHTYLGDWIRQQEAGVRSGADGAPIRLAAAQDLKRRLELILDGEPPYDIFVRWKKPSEQPIGWNPDLNDGVRLNIRPFMTAEVLRHNKKPKLNITWDKDRGKDVESAPWFKTFGGDRINDHHLTVERKMAARSRE
ncbi:MAG: Eco57I restriction-modification methylase domain-containing protein, partial [Rubrivivax sp.]